MWVKIVRDRRFFVPGTNNRVCILYRQGMAVPVKRAWGEQLISDGDAVKHAAPRRENHE
jgi:hypothetical protein